MNDNYSDYSYISKNRTSIMGFAAVWVMLFHSTICTNIRVIDTFIKIGYLGVDIFVFMSGFSMWNSYCVSSNKNSSIFLKRRLKKILPTFIPFSAVYLITYFFKNFKTINELFIASKTAGFWVTLILFRWFIPFIIFCYLITPLISRIFDKFGYKFATLAVLIGLCLSLTIPFVIIGSSVALMILLRIPEFIIGWYYCAVKKDKMIKAGDLVLILTSIFLIYYFLLGAYSDEILSDTGLYWWPITLLVSFMVLGVSRVRCFDNSLFNFCGKYSLELYLWHVFFMFMIIDCFNYFNIEFDRYGIVVNLISITFACLVAFAYSKVVGFFCKIHKKGNDKK